jgi:hypothetical protein
MLYFFVKKKRPQPMEDHDATLDSLVKSSLAIESGKFPP